MRCADVIVVEHSAVRQARRGGLLAKTEHFFDGRSDDTRLEAIALDGLEDGAISRIHWDREFVGEIVFPRSRC